MIARIKWKEGSPKELPDKVEIPIGVELLIAERKNPKGVIVYWLESEYSWGLESYQIGDDGIKPWL